MKPMKHSFEARLRAFQIWQKLGYNPWKRERASKQGPGGEFYKGAFDSIPFLNDDAKRTFVHLLLRPGYMIRDYINGKHDRYLAPLTALIIFYAFFTLISAALQPIQYKKESDEIEALAEKLTPAEPATEKTEKSAVDDAIKFVDGISLIVKQGRDLLSLDQHPELVDSRPKAALAALEDSLRSKGITLFLGSFFLLWFSMGLALRKYKVQWSASAATAAYVLCQFCFFMLFTVLLSWGQRTSVGIILQAVLLAFDYKQWLSLTWRQSIRRTIRTGLFYGAIYLLFWILVGIGILTVAWTRGLFEYTKFVN